MFENQSESLISQHLLPDLDLKPKVKRMQRFLLKEVVRIYDFLFQHPAVFFPRNVPFKKRACVLIFLVLNVLKRRKTVKKSLTFFQASEFFKLVLLFL